MIYKSTFKFFNYYDPKACSKILQCKGIHNTNYVICSWISSMELNYGYI
jgi:hypothetical protein